MTLIQAVPDRAQEIRDLVSSGDHLTRAAVRLMDYAKDFSPRRDLVNETTVLAGEARRLQTDLRRFGPTGDGGAQLNRLSHRILELVDEIKEAVLAPDSATVGAAPALRAVPEDAIDATPQVDDGTVPSPEAPTRLEQARTTFRAARRPAEDASLALRAEGVTKSFRTFTLEPLDVQLRPGEILGLVGVNGSGKTTLLRLLAGELAADGGDLTYPLLHPGAPDWRKVKRQIAFVPQRPDRWHGRLEENLYLHAALHGIRGADNEDEVEFLLHRLGLEEYRSSRWDEISGGFQMRYELARSLAGRPRLLILDEPLAPLDVNTQQVFLQDLRDLADSASDPLPVVLSSQHIFEVEAIADRILFLDQGRVIFTGPLDELREQREESTFELATASGRGELLDALEQLGVLDAEHTGLTYLVNLPPEVTGRQLLEALMQQEVEISYFRDVSGSTRKLFKGRGESS